MLCNCAQASTFNIAADGSSGSPKVCLVFSEFKFFKCRILTSLTLNTAGVPRSHQETEMLNSTSIKC